MNYKDYYKILGISKTATTDEIKKAFRKLAVKHHPDKNSGNKASEEMFKEINEANEVLSDPVKRKKYDQFGADWKHYEDTGARPGGFDWSKYTSDRGRQSHGMNNEESDTMFNDFSSADIFELLFGEHGTQRRGRRKTAIKGEDLNAETILSLEEAYNGTTRLIKLDNQTIKVTIKPGIADQQVLRITGKGVPGSNGLPNGDLYLTIKIAHHSVFIRKGNDLNCDVPVKLYTALLGGKTQVKTMKGTVMVDIPKETTNGTVLRLHGLGMPVYGKKNEFGNLFVKVSIINPDKLNEQEIDLFKKLAALRK